LKIGGKSLVFQNGSVSLIPPGAEVQWHFPPHASHYYAHFKSRSTSRGGCVDISVLNPVDSIPDGLGGQFDDLVRFFEAGDNLRASVRLWDLLFRLTEPPSSPAFSHILHPTLQIALSVIRNNPGKNLSVQNLAAQLGVSRSQLTRLFQKEFQCGAKEYILQANIGRACSLLRRSAMSIKSIAMSSGFNDLPHLTRQSERKQGAARPNTVCKTLEWTIYERGSKGADQPANISFYSDSDGE